VESLRSSIGETEAFMTRGDLARCLSIAQPQNFLNVERDDNNFTGSNIAMAVDNSLESLLATLTTSIQSATEALPQDDILPPKEGISLLDVKNELLLSYLQNLVFLILLKLRARSSGESDQLHPHDEVVQKLVELRIYLEKGVRPLENRLKYNIDKIIRSADDAARRTAQVTAKPKPNNTTHDTGSGSDESDAESAASDQTADSEDEMAYAPNKAAVVRAEQEQPSARDRESAKDGIYRPPKITPMAMPTTEGRAERRDRRPNKSATLDEFIATELSSAPIAEPSIGSTITHGGRHTKSEKERREENERREYEESNFTRLAPKSKKEKRKEDKGRSQGGFGGEEWRGLGAGIDRIERLTQKKEGSGKGSLEKSRKRPVEDGPRGSGSAAGDAFAKRQKVVSRYRK
jgi:U3 small nucleolar ribonucleoprotein protein LCP5